MKLDVGGGRPTTIRQETIWFNHTPEDWTSLNLFPLYNPDVVGGVADMPFAANTFKYVRLLCFPAVWLDSGALREVYRVLKPDGLVVQTTGKDILKNETFVYHWNKFFTDEIESNGGTFVGLSKKLGTQ